MSNQANAYRELTELKSHMQYVALLRGINVGGNHKVEMPRLKLCFEQLGFKQVRTYINTGNVIFDAGDELSAQEIRKKLEAAFEVKFGFVCSIILKNINSFLDIRAALPDEWQNDQSMKCDVLFLDETVDSPSVLAQLHIKPMIDEVKYVPGAVLWRIDRELISRSGLLKLVGTPLYKAMTVRNCNTVRKMSSLLT